MDNLLGEHIANGVRNAWYSGDLAERTHAVIAVFSVVTIYVNGIVSIINFFKG